MGIVWAVTKGRVVDYTFGTLIPGTVAGVTDKVTAALADEGFGILTTIDVAATLKAKLDIDRDAYVILGACNPAFASKAIDADPEIGALLPCNVVLRQEGDSVAVRFMDPSAVLGLVEADGVDEVAEHVRAGLQRAMGAIGS